VEEVRRGPLEVGARRTTYTVGLVVSTVAFAVTAFWVFPHLGWFPPVVIGIVLTAIGIATFAYYLATGPYVFRVDEHGLHDRSGVFQAGKLAWVDLVEVKVVVAEGRPQIGLVLKPAARERASLLVSTLMNEHRAAFGADVIVAPEAMGAQPAEEHVATLRRYLADETARLELAGP
jgi:hypothetical protein